MDTSKNTLDIDIDLGKILYKMRNKYTFVIIITLIATLATALITQFAISPKYSSTTKMYVYSNTDRITTDSSISSAELDASSDLVNTYIYILKSDTVLEAVIKDLDLDYTPSKLRNAIEANQAENTVAFEVTVTTGDPKLSAKIANSIAKIAPSEIVRVVKAGGVEIIDYAKVPTKQASPNLIKNVAVVAILAFVLSFLLFFVYEIFDTTITSERDITGEFDIPILGTVPNLDNPQEKEQNKSISSFAETASTMLKPSQTVIDNLQNMKGDDK